ncbi:hypothetical protein MKW98_023725 [Papaver atlanticum]|uniref:Uncharacterized protein n=1 Tax=Papaver atlanticum TaxID=357466 RepID=A0AAD4SZA8_9MAGN|nr:hypothetical protein MKW98_023725 [Papaver atlanticum]
MDECCSTQLIDGDSFDVHGIARISKAVKLDDCGLSYTVVSITGPQRKITHLKLYFCTNFREMKAFRGLKLLKVFR